MDPLVYILILNWNGKSDTLECLTSIQKSNYPKYEMVVIDNNSSDGSAEAIEEQFPDVTLLRNPDNLGYAEGNNVGIQYAMDKKADYIWILNNDTVVSPDCLKKLVAYSQHVHRPTVVSPLVFKYDHPEALSFSGVKWERDKASFKKIGREQSLSALEETGAFSSDFAVGCGLFFSAQVPRMIGLFDPRFFILWEEIDWCCRARRAGCDVNILPNARMWHKESQTFRSEDRGPLYHYFYSRNKLLWIEKNLKGRSKWIAYKECLRKMKWDYQGLPHAATPQNAAIMKARLRGGRDYLLRRFGFPGKTR